MVKRAATLCAIIACLASAAVGAAADVDEFTRATQNPLAHVISLPLQNNASFNIGPFDRTQNVLNIQPVIPFQLGPVTFASRTIIPVMWQPDVAAEAGTATGLGDINTTLFISPSTSGTVIWGVGPMISIPVASEENVAKGMGYGKWGLGPSLVVLAQPHRWTIGLLLENGWSVAGDEKYDDVNAGLAQPFIIYNLGRGWNVTTSPQIVADWKRDSADRWLVPVGGGGGKLLHLGKLPINTSVQGYYYVVHPEVREDPRLNVPYPEWTLRASATFFLPGI